MKFEHSKNTLNLIKKVSDFMEENIYPAEEIYASEMKAFVNLEIHGRFLKY